jgi:hypothetical protein
MRIQFGRSDIQRRLVRILDALASVHLVHPHVSYPVAIQLSGQMFRGNTIWDDSALVLATDCGAHVAA